jgi:VanZ family protein
MGKLLESRYQKGLLWLILAVLLFAGLQPFNFYPKNQVSWLKNSPGVLFHRYGEVVGESPLASQPSSSPEERGITLELWVSSFNEDPYVKDLLSVYVSRDREPFAIEAWEKKLVVGGIFRDAQGHRKFRHIGIENVFATGARRFVTLTAGPDGTKIYLEGVLQQDASGLTLETENFDGSLLLGQTASGRQEWRGAFLGLGFYSDEFTPDEVAKSFADWGKGDLQEILKHPRDRAIYAFDEGEGQIVHKRGNLGADLLKPKRLSPVDPIILEVPSRRDFMNWSDVAINILGFIPFGLVFAIYLKTSRKWSSARAVMIVIASGFLISLSIELLQVLLPTRDSSLLDLINNTLGSAIGAGVGIAILPQLRRVANASSALRSVCAR